MTINRRNAKVVISTLRLSLLSQCKNALLIDHTVRVRQSPHYIPCADCISKQTYFPLSLTLQYIFSSSIVAWSSCFLCQFSTFFFPHSDSNQPLVSLYVLYSIFSTGSPSTKGCPVRLNEMKRLAPHAKTKMPISIEKAKKPEACISR